MQPRKIATTALCALLLAASMPAGEPTSKQLEKALSQESQPKEVLSQFQRDYILLKKGQKEFENNFAWTYNSANQIFLNSFAILDPVFLTLGQFGVEHIRRHIFTDTLTLRYGILDNLQAQVSVPIIFRHDRYSKIGTTDGQGDNVESTMDKFGLGDISIGISYQPVRETDTRPAIVTSLSYKFNNAKSPFDIDVDENGQMKDLPLGSGYQSIKLGVNFAKTIDPVVVFGGISYAYNMEETVNNKYYIKDKDTNETKLYGLKKVAPGDTISIVLGFSYAVSYNFSLGFQFQDDLTFSTDVWKFQGSENNITKEQVPNTNLNSGIFKLTAGWAISDKSSLNFSLGMGLTSDAPDFVFEVRYPIRF